MTPALTHTTTPPVEEVQPLPEITLGAQELPSALKESSVWTNVLGGGATPPNSPLPLDYVSTNTTIVSDSVAAAPNNELLALVGRDFSNVGDIIDTLQKLASNMELFDAAERDLGTSAAPPQLQQAPATPEEQASVLLSRVVASQQRLDRRRLFLLRRLRRATARGLVGAASGQLGDIARRLNELMATAKERHTAGQGVLPQEKPLSASAFDTANLASRSETLACSVTVNGAPHGDAVRLPAPFCAEVEAVASEMRAATLSHAAHDSDATESSSGGESCDETDSFPEANTDYKPIEERAFYGYCRRRGWISSRASFLSLRIAEFERRAREQRKILSDLERTKECVQSLRVPPTKCSSAASEPALAPNGFRPSLTDEDETARSARTAGLEAVPRRRLYSTRASNAAVKDTLGKGMNGAVAAPFATVAAGARYAPQVATTAATTDDAFLHPQLSVAHDYLQSDTFCRLLNGKVWRSRARPVPAQSAKASAAAPFSRDEVRGSVGGAAKPAAFGPDDDDHHRRRRHKGLHREYHHKRNGRHKHFRRASETERITIKLKRDVSDAAEQEKEAREKKRRKLPNSVYTVAKPSPLVYDDRFSVDSDDGSSSGGWHVWAGSAPASPCPSPAHGDTTSRPPKQKTTRQKMNSASYDINNIILGSSMAATSVEMLCYKEIPTPDWRVVALEPLKPLAAGCEADQADEEEDLGEEAVVQRHARYQEMERQRKLQYLTGSHGMRSARSRRADSSGTNTPDNPLSPRTLEGFEASSALDSPPSTPSEDSNPAVSSGQQQAALRNGTASSTSLSLSLSSLRSSLLKSTISAHQTPAPAVCNEDGDSGVAFPSPTPSTTPSLAPVAVSAGRPRRQRSIHAYDDRSLDKDRVSPYPFRQFPLDDSTLPSLDADECAASDIESSGLSPLSEMTDSASEEDASVAASAAVSSADHRWTISAATDCKGALVITVQPQQTHAAPAAPSLP